MKRNLLRVCFLLFFAPSVFAQNIATVNGIPIPMQRYQGLVSLSSPNGQELTPEQQAQIKEQLINMEIFAQAAKAKRLDQTPAYRTRMDLAQMEALTQMLIQDYVQSISISDDEIQQAYDAAARDVPKEYKAQHILVETETQAQAALARLQADEAFSDLAKELSQDPGSAVNGGDLGWNSASSYVPEFADALTALEAGETSQQPVKTQYGYHIIRLEEVRNPEIPPLQSVKEQLLAQQKQKKLASYLELLRSAAVVN